MSESTLTFRIVAEDNASGVFDQVGQSAQQMGDRVKGTSNDIDSVGQAATSSAGNVKSFGGALASVGLNVGSAAAGIISFVKSFDQLDNAMDKAQASQTKLASASAAVEKAQANLATAIAKFGPNSLQAAQAAEKLDLVLRKEADAAARAQNASENVGFAMANAATGAVQFIAGLAGIGQAVSTVSANMGTLKSGFGNIGSSISTLIGGLTGLGAAAGGAGSAISKLGPMFSGFAGSASNSNSAIASLGGALGNFAGAAEGAGGAVGGLMGILSKLAPVVAIAFGAFAVVDTAISGIEALGAAAEKNFGKAATAIDSMWKKMELGTLIGPQFDFLFKLAGIDMSKVTQQMANLGGGVKDTGEAAAQSAEEMKRLQQVAEEVGGSLSKAWEKGLEGARSFRDKLQDEIGNLKDKARELQQGFVIQADRPGTVKIDWEKVFEFERVQGLIKANMAKMQSAFSSGIEELAGRALPPGLASFGDRMMDALPSADEVSAMMSVLAAGVRKGGTGIGEAAGFISAELREGFAGMDKPARDAVIRIEQNLQKLATLKPNTPAFNETIRQIQADIEGLSDIDATIDIKASTVNVIAGVSQTNTALQTVPTEQTTNLMANPQQAIQGANQAGTAITQQVPAEKTTMLSTEGVSQVMNDTGAVAQAYGLVPGLKNTKVTSDGAPLVIAGAQAIGQAFAAPNYPDNKNTKISETGGSIVAGVAGTIGAAFSAPRYPENKNTKISESGGSVVQGAAAAIGQAFAPPKYPENKNTKITETGGSIVEQVGQSIVNLFKPPSYPDKKNTDLKAQDQASAVISNLKRNIENVPTHRTVVFTVTAQAGAGLTAEMKGKLGLRHGGTHLITSPTPVMVGEGFHPELVARAPVHMAAKGVDGLVTKPTMFMAGEAGPELVNVIPLAGGAGIGASGGLLDAIGGRAGRPDAVLLLNQGRDAQEFGQDIGEGMTSVMAQIMESDSIEDILQMVKGLLPLAEQIGQSLLALIDQLPQAIATITHTISAVGASIVSAISSIGANISGMMGGGGAGGLDLGSLLGGGGGGGMGGGMGGGGTGSLPTLPTLGDLMGGGGGIPGFAKGFNGYVNKPTLFMAGEAGPELVNVIPLRNGTTRSGGDIARLVELFEKFMAMQRGGRGMGGGMNANLFVDGQKMAAVATKYIGQKSYGDR